MFDSAQMRGDGRGAFQLDPVPLVIVDGERNQVIARLARQSGDDH